MKGLKLRTFMLVMCLLVLSAHTLTASEPVDKNARPYRLFFDEGAYSAEPKLTIRQFTGQVQIADVEAIFGDVNNLPTDAAGNRIGGWVLKDDHLWSVVISPSGKAVSLLTLGADGTLSSTLDLNGDRIADVVDIRRGDETRFSFVTEELGREIFELWLQGKDVLCLDNLLPEQSGPIFGCPEGDSSGGSSGGTSGGAEPSGSPFVDPIDQMCSEYQAAPSGFRPPVMAHGGHGYGDRAGTVSRHDLLDDGTRRVEVMTTYTDADGNHVSTYTEIVYLHPNGDRTVIHEEVDHEGHGTRTVTEHKADGSTTTREEEFETEVKPGGTYTPQDRPATDEGGGSESNPGPVDGGDDTALAEFCANWESYVSPIEQAVDTDHSAFQISCDDLAKSDGEQCILIEWARADNFGDALDVPEGQGGCGPLQQPGADGFCEPTTAMERLRGLTALLASANLDGLEICPPIVCNPEF